MSVTTIEGITGIEKQCTGCGACRAACPVDAISMDTDPEGFASPCVDHGTCISCGKCASVCQVSRPGEVVGPFRVMAGCADDPVARAAGSSGGVMGLLAQRVLAEGGVVYGAVFDAGSKLVSHMSTDDVPLERILLSKYVQSEAWGSYGEVRENLCSGRRVLFCGTPCQVAGLRRYLGKSYDNLLTVDFFCHGVPSPGFFSDYATLKEKERGSEVVDMTFREKTHGWREQHMRWYFADGGVEEEPSLHNCHYFFFLGNYSLRKSCYDCGLYERHEADLTLADCWLIDPAADDDLGTSLLLVNTEAGDRAFAGIEGAFRQVAVPNFRFKIYKHGYDKSKRNEFFRLYQTSGAEGVCGEYFEKEHAMAERKNWLMNHGGGVLLGCFRRLRRALPGLAGGGGDR